MLQQPTPCARTIRHRFNRSFKVSLHYCLALEANLELGQQYLGNSHASSIHYLDKCHFPRHAAPNLITPLRWLDLKGCGGMSVPPLEEH